MIRRVVAVAAGLALLSTPAAARDPFALPDWRDAADVPGDPLDLRDVSFGQRDTQLWLTLRTRGDLSAGHLPDEGTCLVLSRARAVARVCVGTAGASPTAVRYGTGTTGRLRRIPGAVHRGGHRSIRVGFHPRAIGLGFGRWRWFVESRRRGAADRAPDRGYRTARIGALGEPRCFGAAARAGRHVCRNPALGRTVTPRPSAAYLMPDSPCSVLPHARYSILEPCVFGDRDVGGPPTVALIGDSHSRHFRSALEVAAQAEGWRVVAMTHPGCALSTQVYSSPDGIPAGCHRHSLEALAWLRAHPTVHTVFTSAEDGRGFGPAGFTSMWAQVPASVRRIYVIRDVPRVRVNTAACVSAVIRRHAAPWRACTVPRRVALLPDPAAQAVGLAGARVHLIDLTRYFCDRSRCYPVVGGAYVYRDNTHLNRVFATTLGPYLLRQIRSIPAGPARAPAARLVPPPA